MKKTIIYLMLSLMNSISFGQSPINVIFTSENGCDKYTNIDMVQNRIITKAFKKDTFTVAIGIVVNCGGISSVKANYYKDTLNFTFDEGQIENDTIIKNGKKIPRSFIVQTKCDCCFEFEFKAYKISEEPKFITFNGEEFKYYPEKYKIYPVKYDIVQSDTINLIDRYGLKQGKWNKVDDAMITAGDKYKFDGSYLNDEIKSSDFTIFNKFGRIKYKQEKRGGDSTKTVSYYENGQIKFQGINNGNNGGSISYHFYENGMISRIHADNDNVKTEQLFYEDGKLKRITSLPNPIIWREYYPNGILKYERLYSNNDNVWAKYYYYNGKIMSIFYSKESQKRIGQSNSWSTYFDLKGNRKSKSYLIKAGFGDILKL